MVHIGENNAAEAVALVRRGEVARCDYTPDEIGLIKRMICKGASDDELKLFVAQCQRTGLDPFSRQIHATKRWDAKEQREVLSIQVGIDGFRLIAERTGEADGQDGPYWCGDDGKWVDVWLSAKPPAAAKVVVYRKGRAHPYIGVGRLAAYIQTKKDGTPNTFWARMPDVMLAKCSEALALRKAFPHELSGLYTADEMGQAEVVDAEPVAPAPRQLPPARPEPTPPTGTPRPAFTLATLYAELAKKAPPKDGPELQKRVGWLSVELLKLLRGWDVKELDGCVGDAVLAGDDWQYDTLSAEQAADGWNAVVEYLRLEAAGANGRPATA